MKGLCVLVFSVRGGLAHGEFDRAGNLAKKVGVEKDTSAHNTHSENGLLSGVEDVFAPGSDGLG